MKFFSYKAQAFILAAGIMGFALLACSPVQVANTPDGEAACMTPAPVETAEVAESTTFVCDDCGETVDGFHECETAKVETWYCDACGEPTTDEPQRRTFDDDTSGDCCEYCAAFFTLDLEDREAIRASWEN